MVKKTASEELESTLRVITAAAPGLRRAGVTRLRLGPLDLRIEPALPEAAPTRGGDTPDADFLDPAKFRRSDRDDDDIDFDGEDRS